MRSFFRGSPSKAILSPLDARAGQLSQEELDEIAAWIRQARKDHSHREALRAGRWPGGDGGIGVGRKQRRASQRIQPREQVVDGPLPEGFLELPSIT